MGGACAHVAMGIGASQLGDAILFPAPPASYGLDLRGLVWIEENFQPLAALPTLSSAAAADQAAQHIARRRLQRLFPACLIEAPTGSECKCVILYWHGNSCDLGQIYEEMEVLAKYLNCHVFAIEFPGPASYLAATLAEKNVRVGGVVLHAPYLSVHKIVQEYSSLGTWLIANHWNNVENLDKMAIYSCPLLIIHGEDDEVIPTDHGRKLFDSYAAASAKEGYFPADSSHNSYYIIDDLGKPMESFLLEKSRVRECKPLQFSIPPYMYDLPAWQMPAPKAGGAAGAGATAGPAAAAEKATEATVTTAPDARAAAVAAAAAAAAVRANAAQADQKVAAEQPGFQQTGLESSVPAWVPRRSKAAAGEKEICGSAVVARGGEADPQTVGNTAAKSVGGTGLGAAAAALLGRGGTALGNFIAHAAGSTGNEWDVGVTHTDSPRSADVTQAGAPARVPQATAAAKNAGHRAATPAAGDREKTEAETAKKALGVEQRPRSVGPRFSEVLESGIFSASTLQEIMGETLKELNRAGEDSPTKAVKR